MLIRRATVADISVIARHRAEMFTEMGRLPAGRDDLIAATARYLEQVMPRDEYLAWLASPPGEPTVIVGGVGLLLRQVPPFPKERPDGIHIAVGRQGLVLNVFTEPAWRRQGVADALMRQLLAWAVDAGLDAVVLHASDAGKAMYQRLGFIETNEMRLR